MKPGKPLSRYEGLNRMLNDLLFISIMRFFSSSALTKSIISTSTSSFKSLLPLCFPLHFSFLHPYPAFIDKTPQATLNFHIRSTNSLPLKI